MAGVSALLGPANSSVDGAKNGLTGRQVPDPVHRDLRPSRSRRRVAWKTATDLFQLDAFDFFGFAVVDFIFP